MAQIMGAGREAEEVNTATLFSTGKDDWGTPPELFAKLDAEFQFTMDVAAVAANALCPHYFGPDSPDEHSRDALSVTWADALPMLGGQPVCWCNPPYSRGLQHKFIAKASEERYRGVTTVMLLPARTDTKSFHTYIWDAEKHQPREGVEVRFLKGRVKFVGATAGAPFPSMVVIFRGKRA